MTKVQDINATIARILDQYSDILDTRAILIERNALGTSCTDLLCEHLPHGTWLVALDEHTSRAAGDALMQELDNANLLWARYDVPTSHGAKFPMCDDTAIAAFENAIVQHSASAAIAVGSGTINDIVKMASFNTHIPMACVGTAPSMNGYTSKIAAVLSHGVKTTIPCSAPRVIIADLDVMATAPQRMIASGLGDLLSKPVSNSDWQLSAELNGSFHSAEAMEVIELGSAMLDKVAPKLTQGDRVAMAGLLGSLMLSGLAMSIAGSSSPASGGEHLISHYIDMTAHAFDQTYDFHGCQVGVGTLTTAYFYEKLSTLDPASIDIEQCVKALPSWEEWSHVLHKEFGSLFQAVAKHAKPSHPTREELRRRLEHLVTHWDHIMGRVGQTLRTSKDLEDELRMANAPVRYTHLDIERARARHAIIWSKNIRNRYTILHLAWELGVLEEWADEALDLLFV